MTKVTKLTRHGVLTPKERARNLHRALRRLAAALTFAAVYTVFGLIYNLWLTLDFGCIIGAMTTVACVLGLVGLAWMRKAGLPYITEARRCYINEEDFHDFHAGKIPGKRKEPHS